MPNSNLGLILIFMVRKSTKIAMSFKERHLRLGMNRHYPSISQTCTMLGSTKHEWVNVLGVLMEGKDKVTKTTWNIRWWLTKARGWHIGAILGINSCITWLNQHRGVDPRTKNGSIPLPRGLREREREREPITQKLEGNAPWVGFV